MKLTQSAVVSTHETLLGRTPDPHSEVEYWLNRCEPLSEYLKEFAQLIAMSWSGSIRIPCRTHTRCNFSSSIPGGIIRGTGLPLQGGAALCSEFASKPGFCDYIRIEVPHRRRRIWQPRGHCLLGSQSVLVPICLLPVLVDWSILIAGRQCSKRLKGRRRFNSFQLC